MPSASNMNSLNCQTDLKVHFDQQRVFPALSNLIVERDDGLFDLGLGENARSPCATSPKQTGTPATEPEFDLQNGGQSQKALARTNRGQTKRACPERQTRSKTALDGF